MAVNFTWVKEHKYTVLGGLAGVLVVLYLLKHSQAAASSGSDLSGGAGAVTNYDAAASLQNAQVNGQVEIAQVQAGVQYAGIQAQSDVAKTTVAAELAAAMQKTSADAAVALGGQGAAVEIQRIQSEQQVEQTQIVGATIETLGSQQATVKMQQNQIVAAQVAQIQAHSKHASQDYTAIAPILAIEQGQQGSAAATAAANAADRTAASAVKGTAIQTGGAVISNLSHDAAGVFKAFFAGGG